MPDAIDRDLDNDSEAQPLRERAIGEATRVRPAHDDVGTRARCGNSTIPPFADCGDGPPNPLLLDSCVVQHLSYVSAVSDSDYWTDDVIRTVRSRDEAGV